MTIIDTNRKTPEAEANGMHVSRLLTANEAAELFGLAPSYSRYALKRRLVPAQRRGRELAARVQDWQELIDSRADQVKAAR